MKVSEREITGGSVVNERPAEGLTDLVPAQDSGAAG